MGRPREIRVIVVSPEEADHGVAELWLDGDLFGFTRMEDGQLLLRIETRPDRGHVVVEALSLAAALARAMELLGAA